MPRSEVYLLRTSVDSVPVRVVLSNQLRSFRSKINKNTFDELTVQFILDEDLQTYFELYNWMTVYRQLQTTMMSKRSKTVWFR